MFRKTQELGDCYRLEFWDVEEQKMYESGLTPMMLASFWEYHAPALVMGKGFIRRCIALGDKNRKLIFEGDIIKTEEGEIAVIEWCSDTEHLAWSAVQKSRNPAVDLELEYWWAGCEVIGNIYENPELLKL